MQCLLELGFVVRYNLKGFCVLQLIDFELLNKETIVYWKKLALNL